MKYQIKYSEEKNLLLKETRGVNFEDVIEAIEKGNILNDLEHGDKKRHQDQRILVVKIKKYGYAVPYVIDTKRKVLFLKTVYPSTILTRRYLKKRI